MHFLNLKNLHFIYRQRQSTLKVSHIRGRVWTPMKPCKVRASSCRHTQSATVIVKESKDVYRYVQWCIDSCISLTCSGRGKAKRFLAGSQVEPPLYWHHYQSSASISPVGGKEVSDYVCWRVQISSCVSWILNRALLSRLFMMSQIKLVCLPLEIPFLMRSLLRKFKLSAINVKTAR